MKTVDHFFKSFNGAENVVCRRVEDKYFNGQFFSPLLQYHLNLHYENGSIQMYYEIQVTLFNQPTATITAFGDKHRCSLQCRFFTVGELVEFRIEKRGLLQMIFNPRPDKYHIVRTKNADLRNRLSASLELNNLYKIAESMPDFSPAITGNTDKVATDTYLIDIQFGAKNFHAEALYSIIDFCKNQINRPAAANTDSHK